MEPNKFTAFFNINIFKKQKVSTVPPVHQEIKSEHSSEINTLLQTDNKEGIEIFIKSGIKFNKYQNENIMFKSENTLIFKLDQFHLDMWAKNNKEDLKDSILKRIESFANLSQDEIIIKDSNLLVTSHVRLIMSHGYDKCISNYKDTIKLFSTPFGQNLFSDDMEKVSQLYSMAFKIKENINLGIKKYSPIGCSLSVTNFQDIHESNLIKIIVPLYNKLKAEQLLSVGKTAKNVEIDALKSSILNSLADKVNNFDINSFSLPAQDTFKAINEICADLETSKTHFTIQQSLHFENIVNKRLPQVIQEYITIPEKYRKYLKHIEDSPDALLEDSLKEIKSNLVSMIEDVQINHIQKMKQSNVYLKSMSL